MKRTLYLIAFALLVLMAGAAMAQDLGKVAREQRQQKRPSAKKVFTNEDIATQQPAAETPATDAEGKPVAKEDGTPDKAKDATADKSKDAAADKTKAASALQQKAAGLKAEIATLTRELNIADRENKLRVANYYADAGNSLRDPKKWAEDQRNQQAELDSKKKAIDDAKAKLAELIEQGRKAGVKIDE